MKKSILIASVVTLTAITCKKEKKEDFNPPAQITDINDLVAPNHFSWRTHMDVKFEITSSEIGIMEIANEQTIIHKAILVPGEPYKVELGLPAHIQTLDIRLNSTSKKVEINSPVLKINL